MQKPPVIVFTTMLIGRGPSIAHVPRGPVRELGMGPGVFHGEEGHEDFQILFQQQMDHDDKRPDRGDLGPVFSQKLDNDNIRLTSTLY